VEFRLCDTPADLRWLFDKLKHAKEYSWDIETTHPTRGRGKTDDNEFVEVGTGFDEKVIGISFCWSPTVAAYLPLYKDKEGHTHLTKSRDGGECLFERTVGYVKAELESTSKDRFPWNGIFDTSWMYFCFGIKVPGAASDGMLAHHLLDENRAESSHRLKDCAATYISLDARQYEKDLETALDHFDEHLGRYSKVPLEIIFPYGCADAYYQYMLIPIFEKRLREEEIEKLYFRTVMPLQHCITQMRITGLPVAEDRIEKVGSELAVELGQLNRDIQAQAGVEFDPGSPEQLSKVFFDTLGLKPLGQRGKNGLYSTSKEVLASLLDVHPIVKLVERHRRVVKLKGTYVDGLKNLLVNGRYYPDYKIHGTVTGRLSERLVVLLPRGEKGGEAIKGLFAASPGESFLFRDLSQIEIRKAAHISQDKVMLNGFRNGGPNYDPHADTAIRLFKIEVPPGEDPIKYVKKNHKPKRSIAKNCVDPDTLVWTEQGPTTICSVQPGDKIWCGPSFESVLDVHDDGGIQRRVAVVSRRGVTVCSEDHRFALSDGTLVGAKLLSPGQVLAEPDVPRCGDGAVHVEEKLHSLSPRVHASVLRVGRSAIEAYLTGFFGVRPDSSLCSAVTVKDPVYAGQILSLLKGLGYAAEVSMTPESLFRVCITSNSQDPIPNDVQRVIPLRTGRCVDLMFNTKDHLYVTGTHLTHNCNFLSIYGGEEDRLATMMMAEFPEIWPDKEEAKVEARKFLDLYFEVHSGLATAIEESHRFARTYGYAVNIFGRRRRLPDAQILLPVEPARDDRPHSGPLWRCFGRQSPSLLFDLGYSRTERPAPMSTDEARERVLALKDARYLTPVTVYMGKEAIERKACVDCFFLAPCMQMKEYKTRERLQKEANRQEFNSRVQSSAVDYTNYSIVLIQKEIERLGLKSRLVLQIHDSIGFLVPDDELELMIKLTKDKMENAYTLSVPITSDLSVGRDWGSADWQDNTIDAYTKKCPTCKSRPPLVTEGRVTMVGEVTSYREVSMACTCGWRMEFPAVFRTELN
jgi:DNA polymerase I-like protein with 3'-5' exonuclease and polymerase domains